MGYIRDQLDPWTMVLISWALLLLFGGIIFSVWWQFGPHAYRKPRMLKATEPTIPDGCERVVFAKDQPEYDPLPASVDQDGTVMTEWTITEADLERLQAGGRIRIWMLYAVRPDPGTNERRPMIPMAVEVV